MHHDAIEDALAVWTPSPKQRLYVVSFSSGTVKVGRTSTVSSRLRTHIRNAAVHGHSTEDLWISEAHDNYAANEKALIRYGASRWESVAHEYFRSASFKDLVLFARCLTYTGTPDPFDQPELTPAQEEAMFRREERQARRRAHSNSIPLPDITPVDDRN